MYRRLLFNLLCLSVLFNISYGAVDMKQVATNKRSMESWNANAKMWDALMMEGSSFQNQIIDPMLEQFIPTIENHTNILEIACGNGFLARILALKGANVWAFDAAENAIEIAQNKTPADLLEKIHFFSADSTDPHTYDQLDNPFNIIICNMALMDIEDVTPIFKGVAKVLEDDGVFVVTSTHTCFEKTVGPIFHESFEQNGTTIHTSGVKVIHYLHPTTTRIKALPELPQEHCFFHRSLTDIFQNTFESGFVIDGFEERAFPETESLQEHTGWHTLHDVPVAIGIRFRKLGI